MMGGMPDCSAIVSIRPVWSEKGPVPINPVKGGGKTYQWGGAKVYHQRSLASVNVRASCSGEVSQRQAGSRLGG